MTNDDSADAANFSAFQCRPESGFRVARVWIDFVFLSGKDAAAFFAEFLTKATDFYAHVSNILCGITSANYSTFSGTLSRQPSPKLRSRTSL